MMTIIDYESNMMSMAMNDSVKYISLLFGDGNIIEVGDSYININPCSDTGSHFFRIYIDSNKIRVYKLDCDGIQLEDILDIDQ